MTKAKAKENVNVDAADLSAESLSESIKEPSMAESIASSMRPPVRFYKQKGTDEFGNPVIEAPELVTIENEEGDSQEVSEKVFKAFYAYKGYKIVKGK